MGTLDETPGDLQIHDPQELRRFGSLSQWADEDDHIPMDPRIASFSSPDQERINFLQNIEGDSGVHKIKRTKPPREGPSTTTTSSQEPIQEVGSEENNRSENSDHQTDYGDDEDQYVPNLDQALLEELLKLSRNLYSTLTEFNLTAKNVSFNIYISTAKECTGIVEELNNLYRDCTVHKIDHIYSSWDDIEDPPETLEAEEAEKLEEKATILSQLNTFSTSIIYLRDSVQSMIDQIVFWKRDDMVFNAQQLSRVQLSDIEKLHCTLLLRLSEVKFCRAVVELKQVFNISTYMSSSPDGITFWNKNFGSSIWRVHSGKFLAAIQERFPEDNLGQEFIELIDFTKDGYVSIFEFRTFVKWFGPFTNSIANMKETLACTWFKGFISLQDAGELLMSQVAGTFVVRFSQTNPENFALEYVVADQQVKRTRICPQNCCGDFMFNQIIYRNTNLPSIFKNYNGPLIPLSALPDSRMSDSGARASTIGRTARGGTLSEGQTPPPRTTRAATAMPRNPSPDGEAVRCKPGTCVLL